MREIALYVVTGMCIIMVMGWLVVALALIINELRKFWQ